MKGFSKQNPRVTQEVEHPLLQKEQGDKSFDCVRVRKKKSVRYIKSRSSLTKNRTGGKCHRVRVAGSERVLLATAN